MYCLLAHMRKHEISPRVNLSNQELGNPVLVTLVRDTIRCVDLTRLSVCSLVCAGRQYLRFSETLIFIARRNTSLGCPTCLTCMAEVKSQGVLESSCGAFRYRACLICVANVMAVLRPDRHAGVGTGRGRIKYEKTPADTRNLTTGILLLHAHTRSGATSSLHMTKVEFCVDGTWKRKQGPTHEAHSHVATTYLPNASKVLSSRPSSFSLTF
jgi:hypothetical protein